MRTGVLGLGVSGVAASKLCAKNGDEVVLLEQGALDTEARIKYAEIVQALGVEVEQNWNGLLEGFNFDRIVVSPGFRINHPALLEAASSNISILGEIELAYLHAKAPIVGITGTNGKSTTTVMTWLMAHSVNAGAILCGNISGSGFPEQPLTDAVQRADSNGVLIAEISSFQLEHVEYFSPKAATIINITPDHIDRHGDFETYKQAKFNLWRQMKKGSTVVIDPSRAELDLSTIPDYVQKVEVNADKHAAFFDDRWLEIAPYLIGQHQRMNAAIAYELAHSVTERTDILDALKSFKGLDHRMEWVAEKGACTFINNSMCTNPAALRASIESIEGPKVVLIGGSMKGMDYTDVISWIEAKGVPVVVFGPQLPGTLASSLERRFPAEVELEVALKRATELASGPCVVMLAPGCASSPPYANFRERGAHFKELVGGMK